MGGKMETGNLYQHIPAPLPEEAVAVLARGRGMRIERIVSKGHCSPPGFWYDQSDDEWVVVLKGEARLRFEKDDRIVHLAEGGYVNIRAHEKHRVEWTAGHTETIWLVVFY
jgi:cupin 2 domain-containing protein